MRKLALFCAALLSALFIFALCRGSVSFPAAAAASLLPAFLSLLPIILKKKAFFYCLAGALAGTAAALLFSLFIFEPALSLCRGTEEIRMRVSGYPDEGGYGASVRGTLLSVNGKNTLPYSVDAIFGKTPDESPEPGDLLTFYGRISPQKSAYAVRDGRFLKAAPDGDFVCERRGADGFLCAVKRLSARCSRRLRELFPGDAGALAAALLCGDRSAFSEEFRSDLYKSGLSHVVAVSGMHVSVVAAVFIFLFGRKTGLILSVPAICLYALFTGCSPSVLRASFMCLVFALSYLLARSYDSLTALAAAGVFIGLSNPFSLLSASFLLSFSATLGIILFCAPLSAVLRPKKAPRALGKALSVISGVLSVTLSALVFTLPLSLVFFRSVSLISPVSNVFTVFAAAPAMLFSAAALALSALFPQASAVFAFLPSLFLRYVVLAARFFGGLSLIASTENLFLVVFVLTLFAVALLVRFKKQSAAAGAALVAVCLVSCLLSSLILDSRVREASVFGGGGVACVCFSGGDKLYALNLPGSYPAVSFLRGELDSRGLIKATAAVSEETPAFSGNRGAADEIFYPSELSSGMDLGGVYAASLYCGGEYALFADFGTVSLLDACAVDPAKWAADPVFLPCGILIVNGKWFSSPTFLSSLCSYCRPSSVLAAESGAVLPENAEDICGCPVTALGDCERVKITMPRRIK